MLQKCPVFHVKKRDKTNNFNYIKCQISSKFGILYHCCPVKVPDDYYKV